MKVPIRASNLGHRERTITGTMSLRWYGRFLAFSSPFLFSLLLCTNFL